MSTLLSAFKMKIEESVTLVPNMTAEEKLKAVQFWNVVSEKLQEIVNNSAADISALAFEMEKQQDGKKTSASAAGNDVLEQGADGSTMVHDPTALQETHVLEELTDDSSRMPFRLDLMASVESPAIAEGISQSLIPSTSTTILTAETSPSLSYVASTGAPLVVSSSPTTIAGHSNALLMLASGMPLSQDGINLIDVSRPSRLQELLSRSVSAGSPTKATTASNCKKGINSSRKYGVASGSGKSPMKAVTIRKRFTKNACKGNNLVTDSVIEENLMKNGSTLAEVVPGDDEDGIDENSMLRNIKIESVVAMNDKNGDLQRRFDENRSPVVENSVLVTVKPGKAVELIGDEDEEEEEEEEEEEDEEGLDGDIEEVILADPVVDQNGKKMYTCTYCQKTYANASAYKAHKYSHTKPYGCTECHARFTTRGNLIVHTRRHTGEKPYGCPQCKAKFSTKGNLKRHIRSHSGARPWECLQCGGRFTEKKSLTVHMRRHTGERPYQCTICGKQFAQTGILQTHMSMHMDQREHLCEHCGKSFRQKSQLRLHMMRHQGVRKYNCDQCDSKFLTKGDLERHHRTHTGERPFVCEMCGKTFTRQQSLNEHMNRHYGLKPYECKYCGKRFAEMSACYKHIKHHERLAKKNGTQLPTLATTKRASMLTGGTSSQASPTSQQFTLDEDELVEDDSSIEKFPVLLRAEVALDVGSEISVVQHDSDASVLAAEPAMLVGDSQTRRTISNKSFPARVSESST